MPERLQVLLVGFGGPETLDEVPAFVESVLGRVPPDHVVPAAIDRYRAIGGGSPLPATTRRQAELLGDELRRRGVESVVRLGMLHASPSIDDAVADIERDGASDLVVLSLTPYRCEVSSDAYEEAVIEALAGRGPRLTFCPDWNLEPGYLAALVDMLGSALAGAPPDAAVIFSAHSLPVRLIELGDPYQRQLEATAAAVAAGLGLDRWHVGYQSVSAAAREPWLRPSVEELMDDLAADGVAAVMVDPIGFISDHVETLFDNDVEHRDHAARLGIDFHRCRCLNEHPLLIGALADVILRASDRVGSGAA